MRRILFVVLPRYYDEATRAKRMAATVVPYGVLSLASYINQYSNAEHKVKILDFNTISYDENVIKETIIDYIKEFPADVVGLSVIFNEAFHYVSIVSDTIKCIKPSAIVVVGGAVGTNLYDEVFNCTQSVDAISYSEGELAWKEISEKKDIGDTIKRNKSLLSREDWENGVKPVPEVVEDINNLPFIDFSLVDVEKYGVRSGFQSEIYKGLPIHTTRGCPFNCIFCAAASVHGKRLRMLSAKRVLDELRDMKTKYSINHVQIDDDQFLLDMDRAKEVLRGIIELDLIPEFDSGFSVRFLDEEIVCLLKQAHVDHVTLAIESGSERMLKEVIDKPLTKKEVYNAVEMIKKSGLYPRAFFVLGIPGETEDERFMTLEMARKLELDWSWFSIAAPFKGSRLYKECVEHGYIDTELSNNTSSISLKSSVINTEDFSAEHISKQAYLFNLDVNFLNHACFRRNDYERGIELFGDFVKKMPSHAFAWYALYKSYAGVGDIRKVEALGKFRKIVENDSEWKAYAEYFGLSEA